ncbi:UDP-glucose dehydrogenase family protein [Inhella gelatinilytica]|uniref:UDP-glucose 6-dehydrogenase n=1 Tax=Inhella gelatinilytica TaxID=2795030 RepID=A0A931IWS2_9BURK|nr:UDP-glucose/GDP-mannose dehydrogenase family protein [Inhella gelatinilytica]MBH9554257.1 UDP-glucose/GDP-mannose dehydrogenase family protein [Inhella gelatinilytica]
MKVTVIGSGYVGLVTGACLAQTGNHVVCLDVDAAKVAQLQAGHVPIHEPGLEAMVRANAAAGRLRFTLDAADAIGHGRILFIGVGTPPGEDGSADLQHVLAAARTIAQYLIGPAVVVNKSTVPVGTADRVKAVIEAGLAERQIDYPVAVVSNPEFLKEGAAVDDFLRPDRIVLGSEDESALQLMRTLYAPFNRNRERIQVMDARSAELTKYAANAMLATRISFMNELAALAEQVGADIEQVRRGMGSDERIGTHFLYAGAGYGGSCFPKDVRALLHTGREHGLQLGVLEAVQAANARQKRVLVQKLERRLGPLAGRTIALWGLAFKPNTDDLREAPSLVVIEELLERGASVVAYDPVAATAARAQLHDKAGITIVDDAYAALDGADALVIITEWREFRTPDFEQIRSRLRQPLIIDGRNLYEADEMAAQGLVYEGVGRPSTRS